MAAKGPKQTPEEAAAPQPPQIEHDDDGSTASLIDVDTQSVRTVPSDFMDQDVQTETQADRIEREHETEDARAHARAQAKAARDKAAAKARRADNWLTRNLSSLSDGALATITVANVLAVVGLGSYVGYKAWGLYERGRLGWKNVGLGLGILGAVGVVETVFGSYVNKARSKKQ